MGKKKATGMSKRLGFTDRATINENKDILRYNERLEREAQGLPPDTPRGRPVRGERPGRSDRPERAPRASRPPRAERPVRPPGLDEEQTGALRAAYQAAVGESGLEAAAEQVLTALVGHATFERATMTGWEAAAGGHAEDRTAEQWELLRAAWLRIRLALLEAYVLIKPEVQPQLDRERKQQARLAKPARPRRRPGRGPGERPAKPPRERGAGIPSPADLARRAAAGPSPDAPADTDTDPARPSEAAPADVETDVAAAELTEVQTHAAPADAETDAAPAEVETPSAVSSPTEPVPEPDLGGADPETDLTIDPPALPAVADPAVDVPRVVGEVPGDEVPPTASGTGTEGAEAADPETVDAAAGAEPEPFAEHAVYAAPAGTDPDDDQLALDL